MSRSRPVRNPTAVIEEEERVIVAHERIPYEVRAQQEQEQLQRVVLSVGGIVIIIMITVAVSISKKDSDVQLSSGLSSIKQVLLSFSINWFAMKCMGALLVGLILFDWIGKITEIEKLRSIYWLDLAYQQARSFFVWIGGWLAYISSFYLHLKLGELFMSMIEVPLAMLWLISTPFSICKGYTEALFKWYKQSWFTIIAGTCTIVVLLAAIGYYFLMLRVVQ